MVDAQANRSRRRVGWHKGSDVDEELWPTEGFGGVSDEQFWDDMASDKPLAMTARTAVPPDPGSRRRLPDVVPSRDSDDRGRGDGSRIASGGSGLGSGAYSASAARSGPADRTVIQSIQTGPQRVQTGPHAIPAGPQPNQTGPQPIQTGPQPTSVPARSYQPGTQPYPAAQSYQPGTPPAPISGHAGRAAQPADPRGRARAANGSDAGAGAAAGEDPLTSAAYSLRPPGAVNGRSYQSSRRSRDLPRDQYDADISQETQTFSLADTQAATGGYPGGFPPFRQYDQPTGGGNGRALESRLDAVRSDTARYDDLRSDPLRTDALRTDSLRADPLGSDGYWSGGRPDPLRGAGTSDIYGSTAGHPYPERPYSDPAPSAAAMPSYPGYGYPVSPADDPREPNGTRGQGRSGTGSWGSRQAHPTGNGYRGPYDPRSNGRSLSSPLNSRAHWVHARGRRRLVHGSPPA